MPTRPDPSWGGGKREAAAKIRPAHLTHGAQCLMSLEKMESRNTHTHKTKELKTAVSSIHAIFAISMFVSYLTGYVNCKYWITENWIRKLYARKWQAISCKINISSGSSAIDGVVILLDRRGIWVSNGKRLAKNVFQMNIICITFFFLDPGAGDRYGLSLSCALKANGIKCNWASRG